MRTVWKEFESNIGADLLVAAKNGKEVH